MLSHYALLLPALLCISSLHAETAAEVFAQQRARPEAGKCLELAVDLANSPNFSAVSLDNGGGELRYRMAWNNIAEGWSWQPGADPARADYYRYKFLPLQSVDEKRSEYHAEDKIGVDQTMQVLWRYDYFLAFENLYDFYARTVDDDAGFVLTLAAPPPAHPAMRLSACLEAPITSESTTFWKATYSHPQDYTLKKRYLVGQLKSVEYLDADTGQSLGRLAAQTGH